MFNRSRDNRRGPDPSDGPYSYQEEVFNEFFRQRHQAQAEMRREEERMQKLYADSNARKTKPLKNPIGSEVKAQMLHSVVRVLNNKMADLLDRSVTTRTNHPTIITLPEQLMYNEHEEGPLTRLLQQLTGFFVEPCRPHGIGMSCKFYVRTDLPRLFHGYQGRDMTNPFATLKPDGWVTRI